jgi:hypothetical protein
MLVLARPAGRVQERKLGLATLARTATLVPSSVTAGSERSAADRSRSPARSAPARSASSSLSGLGSRVTLPSLPSTTIGCPCSTEASSPPSPIAIGTPSDRATIAACAVTAPAPSAIALTSAPSSATSAGPRSVAVTTTPSDLSGSGSP